ncbi:MAG: chemotaxis protein CheA [Pseudomonadota bacterium]
MTDPMDAIRATFFEECGELLEQLEAGLLDIEAGRQDDDTVNAVFRAVHSIKGGAAAFDLGPLVTFAHEFETSLDRLRTGVLTPDRQAVALLLKASDHLADLVRVAANGGGAATEHPPDLSGLMQSGPPGSATEIPDDPFDFAPIKVDLDLPGESDDTTDFVERGTSWSIGFESDPSLLSSGNEPLFLFRALQLFGRLTVTSDARALPPLQEMDARVAYLHWSINLDASANDLTDIEVRSVFEFAEDLCTLTILPPEDTLGQEDDDDAEFGLFEPLRVPDRDAENAEAPEEPASIAVPQAPPSASGPDDLAPQLTVARSPSLATSIRVDLDRVDRLVNLVGELVISQSMLAQSVMRAGLEQHSEASAGLDELQQLTRDIQDSVMSIRAQPVRSLFQRMTRIVREGAQATGKTVRLETEGEGTEIDKTVVERLSDPLTHMIRNAIDHGLESPAERVAAGKPEAGVVRLSARQQSDRVIIEISDDGRGIDRPAVLRRAQERGLIPDDASPNDLPVERIIFMPGFSTSTAVSSMSGRGVGMDVVQRAIRDLNGTVSLTSTDGEGCTISVSLPLTLAILDGMIVRSAQQRMVIPLSAIVETQTVEAARIEPLRGNREIVRLHETFVPLVDLAKGMGFLPGVAPGQPERADDEADRALLFVKTEDGGPYALQVDAIEAQRQVVIKGLGDSFGRVPCVSAATILGDGQVALIVDPTGLAHMAGIKRDGAAVSSKEVALQ